MWICTEVDSLDGITRLLNSLGLKAATAKVVASSSSLNGGGWYYYVWHER